MTGGDKISVPKREAGFFEEVCEMLGARPEECWVFEDSLYALKGAKKAGCFLVGVEDVTAERTREEIREISDIYVTDYAQLVHTP